MTKLSIVMILGSVLTAIAIAGGATDSLSYPVPLFLAGFGVGSMYLAIVIAGVADLWRMDQ